MEVLLSGGCENDKVRLSLQQEIVKLLNRKNMVVNSIGDEIDISWKMLADEIKEIDLHKYRKEINKKLDNLGNENHVCFLIEYYDDEDEENNRYYYLGHDSEKEEISYLIEEMKTLLPKLIKYKIAVSEELGIRPDYFDKFLWAFHEARSENRDFPSSSKSNKGNADNGTDEDNGKTPAKSSTSKERNLGPFPEETNSVKRPVETGVAKRSEKKNPEKTTEKTEMSNNSSGNGQKGSEKTKSPTIKPGDTKGTGKNSPEAIKVSPSPPPSKDKN
jgi:hypothetical protein